jgi:hypothetical protein
MDHCFSWPRLLAVFVAAVVASATALAAEQHVGDTIITAVAVNGGADTANPGTSCIRISSPLPTVCAGYVAIPNNNTQLVAAALLNKTNKARVWLYFSDVGSHHCPGRVYTPCSVISIEDK